MTNQILFTALLCILISPLSGQVLAKKEKGISILVHHENYLPVSPEVEIDITIENNTAWPKKVFWPELCKNLYIYFKPVGVDTAWTRIANIYACSSLDKIKIRRKAKSTFSTQFYYSFLVQHDASYQMRIVYYPYGLPKSEERIKRPFFLSNELSPLMVETVIKTAHLPAEEEAAWRHLVSNDLAKLYLKSRSFPYPEMRRQKDKILEFTKLFPDSQYTLALRPYLSSRR